MKKYLQILKTCGLFKGIGEDGLESMLNCLSPEIISANAGEILLLAGDKPQNIGIALSGRLHIIREDYDGNRAIIAAVTEGGIFAEALCCAGVSESPVTVIAADASSVMLLRFPRILSTCASTCAFHTKLIENMLGIIANKNLLLQIRMEILSIKSVRGRVMRCLEEYAEKRGQEFTIPFNREEMASYICVERSALSHELSKMKRDGLIDYRKNSFRIG